MSAVLGEIEADRGPPTALPLRHFAVGIGLLVVAALAGVVAAIAPGWRTAVPHLHLALAGWVCLTIMGAMVQFVPVWSGVRLHSRRLANGALWLVTVGVIGFAAAVAVGRFGVLLAFAAALLSGFLTFAYNLGRTIARARPLDGTERRFAIAIASFALLAPLGFLLALDLAVPVFASLPVARPDVLGAHATLAVFGAILSTVLGALYQLVGMFTRTDPDGADRYLRAIEGVAHPLGVVGLSLGRLAAVRTLAAVGGVLVAVSLLAFSVVLGRRLYASRVERTPMLSRYAVAAGAMALWAVLTIPAWVSRPHSRAALLGAPGTAHLLTVGVVGFVVVGTLYHVVPFLVWVDRYSDRLGHERVPMIDDLYRGRLESVDFAATLLGTGGLVAADVLGLPASATAAAGAVATAGFVLSGANMLAVIREHGPHTVTEVVLGAADAPSDAGTR